jgi:hypothetical protein
MANPFYGLAAGMSGYDIQSDPGKARTINNMGDFIANKLAVTPIWNTINSEPGGGLKGIANQYLPIKKVDPRRNDYSGIMDDKRQWKEELYKKFGVKADKDAPAGNKQTTDDLRHFKKVMYESNVATDPDVKAQKLKEAKEKYAQWKEDKIKEATANKRLDKLDLGKDFNASKGASHPLNGISDKLKPDFIDWLINKYGREEAKRRYESAVDFNNKQFP